MATRAADDFDFIHDRLRQLGSIVSIEVDVEWWRSDAMGGCTYFKPISDRGKELFSSNYGCDSTGNFPFESDMQPSDFSNQEVRNLNFVEV